MTIGQTSVTEESLRVKEEGVVPKGGKEVGVPRKKEGRFCIGVSEGSVVFCHQPISWGTKWCRDFSTVSAFKESKAQV